MCCLLLVEKHRYAFLKLHRTTRKSTQKARGASIASTTIGVRRNSCFMCVGFMVHLRQKKLPTTTLRLFFVLDLSLLIDMTYVHIEQF